MTSLRESRILTVSYLYNDLEDSVFERGFWFKDCTEVDYILLSKSNTVLAFVMLE
jgi:hypothetical protein